MLFTQADRLKGLEVRVVNSLTSLSSMIDKTSTLVKRGSTPGLLWEDWRSSYNAFDYLFGLLGPESEQIIFLNSKSKNILSSKKRTWIFLTNEYLLPIYNMMDADDRLFVSQVVGNKSMIVALEELLADGNLDNWIIARNIQRVDKQFRQLLPVLKADMKGNLEELVKELNAQNSTFYLIMLSSSIILILFFQLGGSLFVIRSSRTLGLNIAEFEKNMSSVAEGNFNLNLEINTRDELEDIARNFSALTRDLWDRIDSLRNMMENIGITDDYNEMQKNLIDLAVKYSSADSAAIIKPSEEGKLILTESVGFFPPLSPLPDSVGTNVEAIQRWYRGLEYIPEEENLIKVTSKGSPVFIRNNNNNLIHNSDIKKPNYISSAMFIPLAVSGHIDNILCLVISGIDRSFSEMDFSFMQVLGDFIAISLDNTSKYVKLVGNQRFNQEIEVATHIQKTMLPGRIPNLNGIKISAYSDAAKGIGGDYYDFFQMDQDKIAVIICDVSGKGVPASLMMIMIRTLFRSITEAAKNANIILNELNKLIIENADVGQFATASILIIDTRQKTISYSNSAHYPLYLLRAETRRFRIFDSNGLPIGIDINSRYNQKNIKVEPGDYIILFTDGLVEARNLKGEELGVNPILKFLASNSNREPDEVVRRIRNYIQDYAEKQSQHDDQTLIAIKIESS